MLRVGEACVGPGPANADLPCRPTGVLHSGRPPIFLDNFPVNDALNTRGMIPVVVAYTAECGRLAVGHADLPVERPPDES
jgi:hypothetical protein